MIAPLEFSRNAKTVFGEIAAAMTHRKPTTDDARIATAGTPRLVTLTSCWGASRRAASTNSIREAVYMPEFRQLSTAVRAITEFAALATAFSGSLDSAAAMVATSAPVIEKITVTMAAVIPIAPN